jgi:hypothetical protein
MTFRIKLHDSTQVEFLNLFEIKPNYPQTIDYFFFFPNKILNKYTRDDFYNDLMSMSRLQAPEIEVFLERLIELINFFKKSKDNLLSSQKFENELVHLVLLFGASLNSILAKLEDAFKANNTESFIFNYSQIKKHLGWFRHELLPLGEERYLWLPKQVQENIKAVDEYLVIRIIWRLGKILDRQNLGDSIQDKIQRLLYEEWRHLRLRGYATPTSLNSWQEEVLQAHSVLKKLSASPLFLNMNRISLSKVYRNYVAAIGAALAASWSFLADISTYRAAQNRDFGYRTTALAAVFILAYVLKDRLKELSREFLNLKMSKRFPDFKNLITAHTKSGNFIKIGKLNEYVALDIKRLPSDVKALRKMNQLHLFEQYEEENILQYQRHFDFQVKLDQLPSSVVKDMIRFTVSKLASNLDDSEKTVPFYDDHRDAEFGPNDKTNLVQEITTNSPTKAIAKLYYIDAVVRKVTPDKIMIGQYRIVLSKRQLIRVETITECTELK